MDLEINEVTVGMSLLVIGLIFIIADTATPGFFIGVIGTALTSMGLVGIFFQYIQDTQWPFIFITVITCVFMLGGVLIYARLERTKYPKVPVTRSDEEGVAGRSGTGARTQAMSDKPGIKEEESSPPVGE